MLTAILFACQPQGVTTEIVVDSEFTDSSYRVEVYRHPDLPPPSETTVLIVLDGDWYGGLAARTIDRLAEDGSTPPLVVSVGYDGDNMRFRDLTPTATSAPAETGGLDAFARVLIEEVLPIAEEDGSGGSTDARILFGHSLGGLAVTHLWMTEPSLSDRVVAVSPSYWWDDGITFGTLEITAPQGAISVSVGSLENLGMAALAEEMTVRLGQRDGIDTELDLIRGRNHNSVVAPAMELGLRSMLR